MNILASENKRFGCRGVVEISILTLISYLYSPPFEVVIS